MMVRNVLGGAAALGLASSALAAVPVGVEGIFTDAAADFGTIAGYGYVLMGAVVGGLIVFKLIRKVTGKAT